MGALVERSRTKHRLCNIRANSILMQQYETRGGPTSEHGVQFQHSFWLYTPVWHMQQKCQKGYDKNLFCCVDRNAWESEICLHCT